MKYKITAVRKKEMPKKAGGTWTKVEIKTDKTGEQILELGMGLPMKREDVKVGTEIEGYIEKKQWGERDGQPLFNVRLNGITAEYVYSLLLKQFPELADEDAAEEQPAPADDWSQAAATTEPTVQTDDIGF
jgi:hypothetical protein